MKEHSKILIQLLSFAIHNNTPTDMSVLPDWNAVYEEAKAHQIHTLLFPLLQELPIEYQPASSLLEIWKYDILREAALQLLHMEQMEKVFLALYAAGVPAIALKGLILRDFYPHPELRTMMDADILVHKEDIPKAHTILTALGYHRGKSSERHITYSLAGALDIELHELLTEKDEMEKRKFFSTLVWKDALSFSIGTAPALRLSVKDQIIHLLFHEIHHIRLSGLGLRQLCDLTLFLTAHKDEIDWKEILTEMQLYGWDKFTIILLSACRQLFGLSLPNIFSEGETIDNAAYRQLLIEDIISSGVFGKRTREREASRHILLYMKNSLKEASPSEKAGAIETVISPFTKLLQFFFPSREKLRYHYGYAKKYPFLLPLAWIHRALYNIQRLYLLPFVFNKETAATYEARIRLLQWLRIR